MQGSSSTQNEYGQWKQCCLWLSCIHICSLYLPNAPATHPIPWSSSSHRSPHHIITELATVETAALLGLPHSCCPFTHHHMPILWSWHYFFFSSPNSVYSQANTPSNMTFKKESENLSHGLFVSPCCWQSLGTQLYTVWSIHFGQWPQAEVKSRLTLSRPWTLELTRAHTLGHLTQPLWKATTWVGGSMCCTYCGAMQQLHSCSYAEYSEQHRCR